MDTSTHDFWTTHAIKHTKQRELLLTLLQDLDKPSSAEAIYLKALTVQPTINLSTIYRILELFHSKGIIIKTIPSETQIAVYELNEHPHRHYMVCVECQNIFPLDDCPCNLIEQFVSSHTNFKILDHKLEILGYCSHCKP